jgi:hypothetical protein
MKLSRAIKYKLMNLMVPLAVGALKALAPPCGGARAARSMWRRI